MKKIVVVFLFMTLLSKCADKRCTISVLNNTNQTIYVDYSFIDSLHFSQTDDVFLDQNRKSYDTAYVFPNGTVSYSSNRAEPDSLAYLIFSGTRERIFQNNNCVDGKLRLYIFKEETIRNYSWETICKYQMYEKKLTFSEEELRRSNWTVVYE